MRESIGIALCVLCSNIRLHESCTPNNYREGASGDAYGNFEAGRWDQYLVQRASEHVMSIQINGACDILESPSDKILDNGMSKDHSRDDVNWMETVVTCEKSIWLELLHHAVFDDSLYSLLWTGIPFHYFISEVRKVFSFAGCYCGSSVPCHLFAGVLNFC